MSGKALLDAVYAAPGDRGARLVYGDWLQERGDPRGELIALQLREPKTKEQEAREAVLIEEHAEEWIGRLTEITTWVEFELGFLARCGLRAVPDWAVGMREWATVKHVGIADRWDRDLAPLVTHAVMVSLESLRLPTRALEALLAEAKRPSRVRRLTIDGSMIEELWTKLARARVLDALEELEIRGRLDIGAPIWTSRYARVVTIEGGWEMTWTRGDDGRLSSLAVAPGTARYRRAPAPDDLLRYFEVLPADVIAALDLTRVPELPRGTKRALRRQVRVVGDL